jgi:hypothetical protein
VGEHSTAVRCKLSVIVKAVRMRHSRVFRYALVASLALLITALADIATEILSHVAEGSHYEWLLQVTSLTGLGISLVYTLFSGVWQSRRRKDPPRIWRVADRVWSEALVDRRTLPNPTKELRR